jgi:hypothetical protein
MGVGGSGGFCKGRLVGFWAQHLANVLCGFVKLGYHPGEGQWVGLYRRSLEARGHQMQELDRLHVQRAWLA